MAPSNNREVSDKNVLEKFVSDFVAILDKNGIKYILVSGFVAIAHGRSRGTEDVDIIIERIGPAKFSRLFEDFEDSGFECIQPGTSEEVFEDYLMENTSIRFVRKGSFVPEMEVKLAKDALDDYQLENRTKLPFTGLDFWFATIEGNIAFKEELLKSDKDMEDARHLRIIYEDKLNEVEINKIKQMILRYRYGKR